MKRTPFTLIELMVVMAIMAILASLLFPIIAKVRLNARITEAKAQMILIENAIQGYEAAYFAMPWTDGNTDSPSGTFNDAVWNDWTSADQCRFYDKLMELLSCSNTPNAYGLKNARGMRLLPPPRKFSETGMIDFWGNRFGIAMDLNSDGRISGTGTPLDGQAGKVFIWSFGPNKMNEWGDRISPKDDIPSWK
ncbi:MAG: type II secretion system protein [Victivallales bacterium]